MNIDWEAANITTEQEFTIAASLVKLKTMPKEQILVSYVALARYMVLKHNVLLQFMKADLNGTLQAVTPPTEAPDLFPPEQFPNQ